MIDEINQSLLDFKRNTTPSATRLPDGAIILRGHDLTIADVVRVARFGAHVKLTDDENILQRVKAAHEHITIRCAVCLSIWGRLWMGSIRLQNR